MELTQNNLKLRIRSIKPRFINREILAKVAAESIAKLKNSTHKDAKRWITAIAKAVVQIENNDSMLFNCDANVLQVVGTQGIAYKADKSCECEAFRQGVPCWHRCAARLVVRYLEVVQAQN